ncbi:amino acid adenylation domain-containing protein [Streptomyces sp. NPDC059917]|uniref:amino acid adenylation domain-containing protein n=1 Tax=Streptomyces sp. NPDC059917 TaxID=3347002 RepID=UPI00364F327A
MHLGSPAATQSESAETARLTILSRTATLTEALAEWARFTPTAVAVTHGDHRLTYAELWAAIERLAGTLRSSGAGPGSVIALRLARGWRQIVAIGAVLEVGAAFVPVDPAYPPSRQEYVLGDSAATMVIEDQGDDFAVRHVELTEAAPAPPGTAYILYTSGSTGQPKGVVVGQAHVLSLLRSCFALLDIDHRDVWTLFHSYSFDFSVWEMWGCLLSGGRLIVVDLETAIEPAAFSSLLTEQGVTILNLVPSVFSVLAEYAVSGAVEFPRLRYVVFGGEAIKVEAINRWAEAGVAPAASMVNMYGITETTVHVTFAPLTVPARRRDGFTPIGKPLPHLDVVIADEDLRRVPPLCVGEILVAGESLAYGYWRRPELTAERFTTRDGVRYYRSGDSAYADEEGFLYYVGRIDEQVKVRGHRIELAEVEAALREPAYVTDGACVVKRGPAGHEVLVAYVVALSRGDASDSELRTSLRSHLRTRLPAHEVPGMVRFCDRLPLTPSGKVDRARLAAAES